MRVAKDIAIASRDIGSPFPVVDIVLVLSLITRRHDGMPWIERRTSRYTTESVLHDVNGLS